jgi:redox-sensitive bicupin YhaK (pirin superfamily)
VLCYLAASFRQPVPADLNAFVYVHRGKGQVGSERTNLNEGQAAVVGKEGNAIDFHTTVRRK